ncbi:probable disease resistance protein At4g27220 isoform X3 [Vitis vinifera]|uniref:probable disease resistance protein At4g27220 isoform X3 n=1 Tax=Vitis vinifera TaxID=29760 RepID=UPI00053FB70D|nr:probable disease resistance protein At4g27220 isoform X3 [Vitis vinifera]XP_019080801.1 probable disease resistance protein At4g27220 isoform X3 [Vitis vinifera]|eukprot:XP_010660191.1 PREDICTED: probable disease resistance protein At4g27220 isoform X3 [Vitis vinifera]
MTIEDCNAMQQIIACEGEFEIKEVDHVGTNLQLLPKLRFLKLENLPELMNFDYFSSNLETTSQGMCSQGNLDIHMPFFSYQVSFPNLEKLEFINLPKLKEIWHHQPSLESFYNLEILEVLHCSCLLNLIPSYLIQRFNNLKKINVHNCKVLEYTFDLQGLDENVEILPKLETLKLRRLPRLRYIICNEDKNDGMRCLFSSPTLMDFQNLKCLSIQDCAYENNEEGHVNTPIEDIVLFGEKVSFPNLEELKLVGLPKLKMIWHHQLSLEFFCKLRILRVHNCPRLVNLVPSHLIQSFQNLKELNVYDCKALESVFDYRGFNGDGGILSKIETLTLEKLPRLRLTICNEDKNDNMSYLLSPSKFKDFYQLKELYIIDCGMLLDGEVSCPPNLEVLVLKSLPNLKEIDVGIFAQLKILILKKLPRLRYTFASQLKNFHDLKELHIIDCGMEGGRDVSTPSNDVVLFNEKASFLESRASTVNKIMDALRDDNINLIRIWGTAGVGKTTLLKQVAQQANQQQLFTTQAYMDVSWTRDSDKLQGVAELQQKIAEKVSGVPLWLQDGSGITDELKRRLMMLGKILIILDDIWTEVDLVKVGIPFEGDETQCKIVLASRDGDVLCKDMGAQICFQVEPLPPEEAWSFFKKTSGDSVEEDLELRPIAIQVVEECEGLPIAIVTIAKALKDETVAVWKNALEQLRSCSPTNIRAVDKKVYSCLEWSYTHLKGDDVKSLFLLCGMMSYCDISLNRLFQYCMGLDFFDHMEPLEQATNKLVTLVEILKASGLLLDSHKERHNFDGKRASSLLFMDADNKFVRMHGVVREVARAIASKDPHPFVVREDVGLGEWSETDESKRCTFISLNCRAVHELPQGLVCPELQFFLLHNKNPSLNIPNSFFEAMKKLKVLDLHKMCFTTLPSSFDSLANLQTLRLNGCKLVDIALIGKLTKLQVLSLVGSTIQQLPNEMVQLTNLRLLNLNDCKELEVIPPNILSSLSRLECLYMTSSFTQWAVEGESNACLSELNHLSYLTTLGIDIPDANLLPKGILFENLTRYAIFVGNFQRYERYCRTKRVLKLRKVNRSLHLGDGISKLMERSEELEFMELSGTKYVLHSSDREIFLELKHLEVSSSPEIQYIVDSKDQQFLQHGAFPSLESLVLRRLRNLEEVWCGPIPIGSFGNLKTLHVTFCGELKFLFFLSTARGFSQLEEMTIENCYLMQQIIAYETESEIKEDGHVGTNLQLFPKLRSLRLERLPQLINFSSELETSSTSMSTNARSENSFFNHKVKETAENADEAMR